MSPYQKQRVAYTYLEAESIDSQYDEQTPMKIIAENVNNEFHKGEQVRNEQSIKYVINQIYNSDTNWYSKLEEKWLKLSK